MRSKKKSQRDLAKNKVLAQTWPKPPCGGGWPVRKLIVVIMCSISDNNKQKGGVGGCFAMLVTLTIVRTSFHCPSTWKK